MSKIILLSIIHLSVVFLFSWFSDLPAPQTAAFYALGLTVSLQAEGSN